MNKKNQKITYKKPQVAKKTQQEQAMIATLVPYPLYIYIKDRAIEERRSLSAQVVLYLEEHLKNKDGWHESC
jgi:hypothetical protein